MTEDLEQTVETLRQEVDALQVAAAERRKPWYRNTSTLLSVVALLFSFSTTYLSYRRTSIQDLQNTRQELRSLLQRLAALPKENVDIQKKYSDDPAAMQLVGGFINQENTLLARQAAEICRKLPADLVSGTEYYAIAVALQNAYDLAGCDEFLQYSIQVSKDFNTEIAALRSIANLKFIQGHPEDGRAEYQKALAIFSKYPGYDPFTVADTNVFTELAWAFSEASIGSPTLAARHLGSAKTLASGLPPGLGTDLLRSRVAQAEERLGRGLLGHPDGPSAP